MRWGFKNNILDSTVCSESEKLRMPRVDRVLETMSWMRECTSFQEELEWLQACEAGIEHRKTCK